MEEENNNVKSELKLDYSLKEALALHRFEMSVELVFICVCIFRLSTVAGNEGKSNIEIKIRVPLLALSIFSLFISLFSVFSLTRCSEKHLFVALFALQLLQHFVRIGGFVYLFAFVVSYIDFISQPYFVFGMFALSYFILDPSMVSILLISILVRAKPSTTFLCKCWFIKYVFLLIFSHILICFYAYLLMSGRTFPVNIIFFVISLLQAIVVSVYTKKKYFKPQSWEPKPLEAKVPEGGMLVDAVLLIAAMEEKKVEAAGAA